MQNPDLIINDLSVTEVTKSYLAESAKWGKFLAIVGFIGCGFMVIAAFFLPALMSMMPEEQTLGMGMIMKGMGAALTIMYLIFAFLFFMPCLYLFKFSQKMKQALTLSNDEILEDSFSNLKSLFKFFAIMTIITLAIYALSLIIVIAGAALMAGS